MSAKVIPLRSQLERQLDDSVRIVAALKPQIDAATTAHDLYVVAAIVYSEVPAPLRPYLEALLCQRAAVIGAEAA